MILPPFRSIAAVSALALLAAAFAADEPGGPPVPASGPAASGPARAIDGDTLELAGHRVRLHGIDAPERAQRCTDGGNRDWACGQAATRRLAALLETGATRCSVRDTDRYGRLVAVCSSGGRDLGGVLVREGLARAYTAYDDAYVADESAARAARRGIWQGAAEAPWSYRAAARTE